MAGDWNLAVSLGDVITASAFVVSGVVAVLTIRNSVGVLTTRVELTDEANQSRFDRIEVQISKLANVVVDIANMGGRLNVTDERMLAQGKRVDAMAITIREILMKLGGIPHNNGL
jgi:hypothetical protein